MKRILSFTLTICLLVCTISCLQVFAADNIEIYLFGKKVECDVAPVIEDGRTLVPVRVISEEGLGADVKWNGEKKQVTITKDKFCVVLTIGSKQATVNGVKRNLDVPAKLISDRTMVPVRFIGETFKYEVGWDNDNRRVVIDKTAQEEEKEENPLIENISVRRSKKNVTLKVSMSKYKKPKIFTLKQPYRIVLDFENYDFEDGDDAIDVGNDYVKQVRHARNEGFYRIVVECAYECEYDYEKTASDGFSLIIEPGEESLIDDEKKNDSNDNNDDKDNKSDEEDKEITEEEEETEEKHERKTPKKPESVKKAVVVIDAGHGGKDPGALGRDEEGNIMYDEDGQEYIKEKDINLIVAKKVYDYLDEKGINAILTRSNDVYLELRDIAHTANKEEAHLFVSIHCNSVDGISTAEGVEVLYFDKETDGDFGISSKDYADKILEEIIDGVDTIGRGLKERPGLAVLKWTEMPAALVELGFVTNSNDQERLLNKSWRNSVAEAIAEGIISALKSMVK